MPPDYLSPEWFLVYVTAGLATITAALAIATYRLYRATVNLGRDAKDGGATQVARMDASVKEAARAATAMEGVATGMQSNASLMQDMLRKQQRAYISVEIGSAHFQDSRYKFQAHPVLTNTGFTPARSVSFRISSAILDIRDEQNLEFFDTKKITNNDASLSPRQQLIIHGPAIDRVPEDEVQSIRDGASRRLCVWGSVNYDDVYGEKWETKFCMNYMWIGNDATGFYFSRNNSAT
jgi:hypothetical protein